MSTKTPKITIRLHHGPQDGDAFNAITVEREITVLDPTSGTPYRYVFGRSHHGEAHYNFDPRQSL